MIYYPPPIGMSSAQTQKIAKGKYRPEIDGLRAFAVVAVIINHFNKNILPGGYLGVDIFFVISGYVITSSLYGRPSKDFKDFISGFYERRIKRLVPPLSVFVVITTALAALFISPHQGTLFLANWRTGISSLFGFSNLYLYKQATDYFGASSELNAFMHTWSLGVEEQFYLIFPFLVWFSGYSKQASNGARNLFFIVTIFSVLSMASFIYLYSSNQPAAYFLMPSRFWEMAGGCLIFIGFQKRASTEQFLEQIPPTLVLALIIAVMYLPEAMAAGSTIAIVALSSILIASLKEKTSAYKLFTHKRVVYIGLISYSLYLWHWAVLAVSRWTIGISWWSVPFQIAVLFVLSDSSYRYIETPSRRSQWKRSVSLFSGIVILIGSALTVFTISNPLKGMIYLGQTPKKIKTEEDISCDPRYKVVFVGDSHAGHYEGAKMSYCNHVSIETLSVDGTPYPTINYTSSTSGRTVERNKLTNKQMESLIKTKRLPRAGDGVVVVSIRAPLYFYSSVGTYKYDTAYHFKELDGSQISRSEALAQWIQKLNQWISSNPETDFILLSPIPDFTELYPQEVCSGEWFQSNAGRKCKSFSSRLEQEERHGEFSNILRQTASYHHNSYFIEGTSLICADNHSQCETELKGKRLYSDDNHITKEGAREAVGKLLNYLESKGKFSWKS